MKALFDLQGRRALVVGACGNIGRAICRVLAAQGALLTVADVQEQTSRELCDELARAFSGEHEPLVGDWTDEQTVCSLLDVPMESPYQIVVHCIGLISSVPIPGYAVPFEQQTLEAWNLAIKTNLTSAFLLAKYIHPRLDRSGCASVMFLSSIYGSLGPNWNLYADTAMGNPVAYGASKGGLEQLARYLATQWAPNIRVNCVSPGGIERGQPPGFISRYEQRTPMKRMAQPDDVAGPVAFLASDAARYITGQNILVDGGWSAW